MPILQSFTHSAERLLEDALALWMQGRQETATHLAGLSAECALKSIFVGLGVVSVDHLGEIPKTPANKTKRVHIDRLWGEFRAALSGHAGAAYVALLPPDVVRNGAREAPFHGWRVEHRYVAHAQLSADDLEQWMWTAIAVKSVLETAKLAGDVQT